MSTLAWAMGSLIVLVAAAGLSLTYRGRDAMDRSNQAFDDGRVRDAVVLAREAALNYVPGAQHVRSAHERIEAVARGAEAEGDRQLARFAWDTLRLVHLQTAYPGRLEPPGLARAEAGLRRIDGLPPSP